MTSPAVAERTPLDGLTAASLSEQLLGFVARSHARACAALVLVSLACFLPGFASLHPMDRDEPRFAQASKQMLETGDFVDIRFQDEARHKKPAGIYWLQSAAVATAEALGSPRRAPPSRLYRIPSLLGAVAAVLLTYWAALAFVARREAFLAAAFMAASMILAGRSASRQDGRHARRLLRGRDGRAGAGLARPRRDAPSDRDRSGFLGRVRGGLPDQGAARADVRRPLRRGPLDSRAVGALAAGLASGSRPPVDASRGRALVRRHRDQERGSLLPGFRRGRHARQGRDGAAAAWGSARLLSRRLLRHVLARGGVRGPCGALRVAASARGRLRLRARLGRSRPGSSSRRFRPSCRITSCRSTRPSPSRP